MKQFFVFAGALFVACAMCAADSLIDRRDEFDKDARHNPFVISAHRATYFLPLSYETAPHQDAELEKTTGHLQSTEVKFQISLKVPIARGLFDNRGDLEFGYTQLSFWQAYNRNTSAPFRDINHEPELMLTFPTDRVLGPFWMRKLRFSVDHQSNGRFGALSRSWNRVYTEPQFEMGNFYLSVRAWYRIPESASSDDNPDIEKYLGYGDIHGLYAWGAQQFGFMLRNNLRPTNRGTVQLDWNFPLYAKLRGYVQLFNGFGESLLDYNHHSRRIGIGIMLANWL